MHEEKNQIVKENFKRQIVSTIIDLKVI